MPKVNFHQAEDAMELPQHLLCPLPENVSLIYRPVTGVTLEISPTLLTCSFKGRTIYFKVKEGKVYGSSSLEKFLIKGTYEMFIYRIELLQYLAENRMIIAELFYNNYDEDAFE